MKKLLLISKGLEVIPEVVPFCKKIAFIPTAGDAYEEPHFVKRTFRQIKAWGYDIVELKIDEVTRNDIIKGLEGVDVLFIVT
ncbi:MAG: type 1 glutamine amidotransferase-like domain-containing protein [Proteobacteria bacterium]|nr:type 1 glutamine amidotransferase-like domain-containing protein [Pseudomonadota bacterium]